MTANRNELAHLPRRDKDSQRSILVLLWVDVEIPTRSDLGLPFWLSCNFSKVPEQPTSKSQIPALNVIRGAFAMNAISYVAQNIGV